MLLGVKIDGRYPSEFFSPSFFRRRPRYCFGLDRVGPWALRTCLAQMPNQTEHLASGASGAPYIVTTSFTVTRVPTERGRLQLTSSGLARRVDGVRRFRCTRSALLRSGSESVVDKCFCEARAGEAKCAEGDAADQNDSSAWSQAGLSLTLLSLHSSYISREVPPPAAEVPGLPMRASRRRSTRPAQPSRPRPRRLRPSLRETHRAVPTATTATPHQQAPQPRPATAATLATPTAATATPAARAPATTRARGRT